MDFALLTSPKKWCFPAFAYALLVLLGVIFTLTTQKTQMTLADKVRSVALELVAGVIMLYILLLLCKYDMELLAWALLLMPAVIHALKTRRI
jgi:hypothetical protein